MNSSNLDIELENIIRIMFKGQHNPNTVTSSKLTKEQKTPQKPLNLQVPDVGLPSDRLGKGGEFSTYGYTTGGSKRTVDQALSGKDSKEPFEYFDFAGIAKIPYAKGGTLHYFDDLETGKILGLTQKDKFGYYDEIFVDSFGENIRRYYPTNDWDDWAYLKSKKVPYAITTKKGDTFHLILKMVDPNKSIIDLDDPNNKSRGWALSYPGMKNATLQDSGTGYYRTEGNEQIPYNITAPIVPGDEGSWDLDGRSGFDKFMDSWAGTITEIVITIAVTILTRNFVIGRTAATVALRGGTSLVRSRLLIAELVAGALVNIPTSMYYFNREGYEAAGWMSLAFCFLPLVQASSFGRIIFAEFSEKTCLEVSQKIFEKGLTLKTGAQVKTLLSSLTMNQRAFVIKVLENSELAQQALKGLGDDTINKLLKGTKSSTYEKLYKELDAILKSPSMNVVTEFAIEISFAFAYGKFFETILNMYNNYLKNRPSAQAGAAVTKLTPEQLKENLGKVEEQIDGLPEWVKLQTKKEDYNTFAQLEITDDMMLDMLEKGILSDSAKKKLYDLSATKAVDVIKTAKKTEGKILKELKFEEFKAMMEFSTDVETMKNLSPEKRLELQKEDEAFRNSEVYKNYLKERGLEPEEVTKKPEEKVAAKTIEEKDWIEVKNIGDFAKYSVQKDKYEVKKDDTQSPPLMYYREKGTEKINKTYSPKSFYYMLKDGKYYYKGADNTTYATKYPKWTEATGKTLDTIKKDVKFE